MKYEALIYNKKNDVVSFIRNFGNKYYGCSLTKCGIKKIEQNMLLQISKILFCDNNWKYIENHENYQVFYDEENNLKHFIKDSKEDLELFIKFNAKDCLNFLEKNDKVKYHNRLEPPKKITLKDYTLIFTKSLLTMMITFSLPFSIHGIDASQAYDALISLSVYDMAEKFEVNLDKIDKEECLNLIYDSKYLSEELKEKFANEDLFDDVFPYYENTCMEYFLRDKFTNLHVREFGKTSIDYYREVAAFYTHLNPNVLYDKKDDIAFGWAAGHEYIHLLQAPFLELDYIVESTASILHYEYYDMDDQSYNEGVKNVRLLMDVIGPKTIFQYIFSGNISPLENILKNNLSENNYNRIMDLLIYKPSKLSEEQHKEIENIIGKLYYEIYNKDIKKDINIYFPTGEFIDGRIYCNRRKMTEEQIYSCTKEIAIKSGIITENIYYIKKVPEDKLEEYRNDPKVKLSSYTTYVNGDSIASEASGKVKLKLENGSIISLDIEEAYKLGYLKEENVIFVKKEDIEDYAFLEDFKYPFKNIDFKYPNVSYSMDATDEYPVKINVESIATRLPNEMIDTYKNDNLTIKM